MTTEGRKVGAKILLYDDGTAASSVFLIGPNEQLELLTYELTKSLDAAHALVRDHAKRCGVDEDHIEIKYEDLRTTRPRGKPIRSKMN